MKLIITRHGRTRLNDLDIIMGHLDEPLNETGHDQAKKLAQRLKDEEIDIFYCSDLARAKETCEHIRKHHPNIKVIYTNKLRESDAGSLTGKSHCTDETWNSCPGTEKDHQLYDRITDFLKEILPKHKDSRVCIVSHAGTNRAIMAAITGLGRHEVSKMPWTKNCSITIYEWDGKNHSNELFNCRKHLE